MSVVKLSLSQSSSTHTHNTFLLGRKTVVWQESGMLIVVLNREDLMKRQLRLVTLVSVCVRCLI